MEHKKEERYTGRNRHSLASKRTATESQESKKNPEHIAVKKSAKRKKDFCSRINRRKRKTHRNSSNL